MAKEFYGYFDSLVEDEREYDAAQFAHILRAGMGNGVTSHAGGGLQVTAPGTGMTTQVSPGGCVVNGYLFVLEDDGGGVRSFSHQQVTLEGVHDLRMHGLIQRFLRGWTRPPPSGRSRWRCGPERRGPTPSRPRWSGTGTCTSWRWQR